MASSDLTFRFIGEDVNAAAMFEAVGDTLSELGVVLRQGAQRIRDAAAAPLKIDFENGTVNEEHEQDYTAP